jgi:hypothetical protein
MPPLNQTSYEGVVRRIRRIILVLGVSGAVILGVWKGVRVGGGFLIGVAISYLSFWRWQRLVESIGSGLVRRSPWMLALRFIVLLSAGYVIIKVTGVNQAAVLGGLFVPGAAVTVEIIYELIYGT